LSGLDREAEVDGADQAGAPSAVSEDTAARLPASVLAENGAGAFAPPPGSVSALQRSAGNRATAALLRARAILARLGTPLDQPLPASAEKPKHGEDPGSQRRYSRPQFIAMWEAEQGRRMTMFEHKQVKRGCIGITATNLGSGDPPLDEVYSTFAQARAVARARNAGLERYPTKPWVVFGMHFWSNQDPVYDNRRVPDPTAFLPDASGRVDMTGYIYENRPKHTNYDYGFWDDASASIWHANHYEIGPADPMKVYQSTFSHFSYRFEESPGEIRYGYPDFDREVWGVAQASGYDPSKATKPKLTSPRLVGDPTIERVFRAKATLGPGSPARAVRTVQRALVDRGYDLGPYGPAKDGVDGWYGDKTSDAVKKFKADENLGAQSSGRADRGVIYRLDELFPP
jgi:Putative peptidoglycan binding domain